MPPSEPTAEDRHEVAQLVHRLAEAVDRVDGPTMEALMTEATFALDDLLPIEGGAAFRTMIERNVVVHDGSPRTQHVVTGLRLEAAPESGDPGAGPPELRSRCDVTVLQAAPSLPLQVILAGTYHDTFVGGPGAWRFAARHLRITLAGDTSQHSRSGR